MVGIVSNQSASIAQGNLAAANNVVSKSVSRLSSGNKITSASDDAAGLAVGTRLQTSVTALKIGLLNANQAGTVLQIADGALKQVGDILSRQKALSVQANSGSLSNTERGFLDQEFSKLSEEVDRIVGNTSFNGITLLNGSIASAAGLKVATPASGAAFTVAGTYSGSVSAAAIADASGATDGNLIGALSGARITGQFDTGTIGAFTLSFNGSTYTTAPIANITTATSFVFTNQSTGTTITLTATAAGGSGSQTNANTIAANLQAGIAGLTVYQDRTFATTTDGIPSTNAKGTLLDGLSGSDVTLRSTAFDVTNNKAPNVGSFSVVAETSTTDGKISTSINGVEYRTVAGGFDGDTNIDNTDSLGAGSGKIRLYKAGDSTANPNDYITIDLANVAGAGSVLISTDGGASQLQSGLNALFGIGSNGGLSFQVGSSVSDKIDVSIGSVKTQALYQDANGATQTLDISTAAGAKAAGDILDLALNKVTAARADIGALQSRFNFASSNLQIAIANQDAARSSFLDADVSEESTNFANAQVKLQASVSVLAQANQLPQNLLRLLQ